MQGIEGRGLQSSSCQFQSCNNHDDPDIADATYIEPLTADIIELIIKKERPDALLPTMGGQTALNLAVELAESGALEKYKVELIGAKLHAIKRLKTDSSLKMQ